MKLMLIENDQAVATTLKKFCQLDGHQCEVFYSSREGVAAYKHEEFDVVLTDIRMPEMDGIELLKNIRSLDPEARVILMTGFLEDRISMEAARHGVSAVLSKPFKIQELLGTLSLIEGELKNEAGKN